MSKQVWICETCGKLWETHDQANSCEVRHPAQSTFRIKAVRFIPSDWTSRELEKWPKSVTLVSDTLTADKWEFDYAKYELKQIGPKGC